MLSIPGSAQSQDPKKFWYGADYDKMVSAQNYDRLQLDNLNQNNWQDVLLNKAKNGDNAALDLMLQYWMSESSLQSAREYESKMNSSRYQTMVEDAKKAGLNPYWVAQLGSAPNYSGSSASYSSSNYTTAQAQSLTYQKNIMTLILGLVGLTSQMFSNLGKTASNVYGS